MTKYEYEDTKEMMEESSKENNFNRAQTRKLIACTTGSGPYKPLSLGSDVLGLGKCNAKGRYTDCAIPAPTGTQ
jgi:hypothetical protein